MKKNKKRILIISIGALIFFGALLFSAEHYFGSKSPQVLGEDDSKVDISFSGEDNERYGYGNSFFIPQTIFDEPVINVSISGNTGSEAKFEIFELNKDDLPELFVYTGEYQRKNLDYDTGRLNKIYSSTEPIINNQKTVNNRSIQDNEAIRYNLPSQNKGLWLVRVSVDGEKQDAVLVRSKHATVIEEGNNDFIFWVQNLENMKKEPGANIALWNLKDKAKKMEEIVTGEDGIGTTDIDERADIAVIEKDGDVSVLPVNLVEFNTTWSNGSFVKDDLIEKYFVFTDRSLYKPGDVVHFKAIIREDDDFSYQIPDGKVLVEMYDEENAWQEDRKALFSQQFSINNEGSIFGDIKIPSTVSTGGYLISVKMLGRENEGNNWMNGDWYGDGTVYFQVEHYQKPEYGLDIVGAKNRIIAGEKAEFEISGSYFFGEPLAGKKVDYKVSTANFYHYYYQEDELEEITDDWRYNYWYGEEVSSGSVMLDENGTANVSLPTNSVFDEIGMTHDQIYSIEAEYQDETGIPVVERKNILVMAGEYRIVQKSYDHSNRYRENQDASYLIKLIPFENSNISNVKLSSSIELSYYTKVENDGQKYPSYEKHTENINSDVARAGNGEYAVNFKTTKGGSYKIKVEGKDSRGNLISNIFYVWVSSSDSAYFDDEEDQSGISLVADRERYLPGDDIRLDITSEISDRDVLLLVERYKVHRYEVVRVEGKLKEISLMTEESDLPNIFLKVVGFSKFDLDSDVVDVEVSPAEKEIQYLITPDRKKYGPGENAVIDIYATKNNGNPISIDTALWAVDKAIFELTERDNRSIFESFWRNKYNDTQSSHSLRRIYESGAEMGGCFTEGTEILMEGGQKKKIEEVVPGDRISTLTSEDNSSLIIATVNKIHSAETSGFLIINGKLRVTPDHILRVNNLWRTAGDIQIGDELVGLNGEKLSVESVDWHIGKAKTYNLEIGEQHTFFADGIWVHNEKGGGGNGRSIFKDTAYWNPSFKTGRDGHAKISFKLPDNLTTWVVSAIGATDDTRVGEGKAEILVSKDVIIRPIYPNIMRIGDELFLSALVHNFTDENQKFDVSLDFPDGDVEGASQQVEIKSGEFVKVGWKTRPAKENSQSVLNFSARNISAGGPSDEVKLEIPLERFGYFENSSFIGDGDKTFSLNFSPDIDKDKSSINLSLAPSLIGSLPSAMKYLIHYPYGCVEQTTSSFVPAVIVKANPNLFPGFKPNVPLDEVVKKGIERLALLQQDDGGWGWWWDGGSDAYISAYAFEYLVEARKLGFVVDDGIYFKAVDFFKQDNDKVDEDIKTTADKNILAKEKEISRIYALSLIGDGSGKKKLEKLEGINPEILAMAVMANIRNGYTNAKDNGIGLLISSAKIEGELASWSGSSQNYYTSNDSATAWAVRALMAANVENLAGKAIRYLAQSRKKEYWSNSYATSRVIRAFVEYSKFRQEADPDFTYTVSVREKVINTGRINKFNQTEEINIPVAELPGNNVPISIRKNGEGQLYSTLTFKEFRTEKNPEPMDRGMTVKREYQNVTDPNREPKVGDIVKINIEIGGLSSDSRYLLIEDFLPAGMVPVNMSFKNSRSIDGADDRYGYYYDKEITKTGAIISNQWYDPGSEFSYLARVVNSGFFSAPPAIATLMYSPEVFGRSATQDVRIHESDIYLPNSAAPGVNKAKIAETARKYKWAIIVIPIMLLIVVGYLGYVYWKRKKENQNVLEEKK